MCHLCVNSQWSDAHSWPPLIVRGAARARNVLGRLAQVSPPSEMVEVAPAFAGETAVSNLAAKLLQSVPAMTVRLVVLARAAAGVWTGTDGHSGAVTADYHGPLTELARRDERQRTLLLDALFEGRRAEWNVLNGSLRALDLPDRGPYVAVSAETPEAGTE